MTQFKSSRANATSRITLIFGAQCLQCIFHVALIHHQHAGHILYSLWLVGDHKNGLQTCGQPTGKIIDGKVHIFGTRLLRYFRLPIMFVIFVALAHRSPLLRKIAFRNVHVAHGIIHTGDPSQMQLLERPILPILQHTLFEEHQHGHEPGNHLDTGCAILGQLAK